MGSRVYLKIPLTSRCHYHNILKDFAEHLNHSSPEVADELQLSRFHAEQRLRMVVFVINCLSNSYSRKYQIGAFSSSRIAIGYLPESIFNSI